MEIFGASLFFIAALFGAIWGSFLNVCIYRIPLEKSVVFPASSCPKCQNSIVWYDNIPIISWILLKGRCRHCQNGISAIYPLVEAITALLTLQVVIFFGFTWESLALLVLGYAFIVLAMIDFEHYILPDVITLPGIVLGLILTALPQLGAPLAPFKEAIIGVAVGGGGLWAFAWIFEKITKKTGMGLGDVKLLALIGAWLGWQALPFTLFLAAIMGSVVGLTWMGLKGRDRQDPIPFGPYLILAGWGYIFYGAQVYEWYLRGFYPGH
jgi:leader peptidase (prepilin peptidase) / N-methyltransferase